MLWPIHTTDLCLQLFPSQNTCIHVKEGNNSEFSNDKQFRIPLLKAPQAQETSYSFVKV